MPTVRTDNHRDEDDVTAMTQKKVTTVIVRQSRRNAHESISSDKNERLIVPEDRMILDCYIVNE